MTTTTLASAGTPGGSPLPAPSAPPPADTREPKVVSRAAAPAGVAEGPTGPEQTGGAGGARKRGQRGPDKRPRKRKAGAAPSGADAGSGASPFAGRVAGEGEGEAKRAPPRGKAPVLEALPPEDVARLLYDVSGVLLVSVAAMRYGPDAQALAFTADERGTLEPLTAAWLKEQTLALTTGEALALALTLIVGQKIAALEIGRIAARGAAPVPASAAIVDVAAEPVKP